MPDERTAPAARRPALRFGLLALPLVLGLVGGCDDPTCVFAGNCFAAPLVAEGALGASAIDPVDGELILTGAPTISAAGPNGDDRHSATPVVLFFSESMAPDSVTGAFELVDDLTQSPIASDTFLLSDGRVLVLLPRSSLSEGDYSMRLVDGAVPADLGGTEVDFDASQDLPSFSVGAADPAKPEIVAVYPPDGSTNASSATEVVCLFDRRVDAPLALDAGWDVTVRPAAGMTFAAPPFDPDPTPLQVPGFLGLLMDDTRVWTWRSTDGPDPVRLETSGAEVAVTVSPAGSSFTDSADMAQTVDELQFSFTLSAAPRPIGGLLNPGSEPQDAIGIANLDGITTALDLALQVDFPSDDLAMDGDVLTVFVFGTDPNDPMNRIGFSRSVTLSSMAPIMTATVDLADLDLTTSTMPLEPRVADGSVRFALRLERGGDQGYLRILDVDLVTEDVQDAVLDTARPQLLLLDAQLVDTDDYLSDQVDLVVAGHADVGVGDFVRGAVVSTTGMGDNIATVGVVPEVIGSADSIIDVGSGPVATSMFVAAPVSVGRLAPAAGSFDVTVTAFDRALNSAETSLTVPFRQRGAVGLTPLDPTSATPLVVEVYDEETLLPIQGALVYSHAQMSDGMGGFTYPMLSAGGLMTDAMGVVSTLPHHDATQLATLVTVVAAGYDAFTFQGVPTDRLSVPLTPAQEVPGVESSSVIVSPGANISTFARRVADTRRSDLEFPSVPTQNFPGTTEYDFDVDALRPFRLGAQSFLAGILDADPNNAGKDRLVKAFDLRLPVDGQESAIMLSTGTLTVNRLLDDPLGPSGDVAKSVTDVQVDATAIMGMNPENLQDDTQYGRQPLVAIEATMPGVDRPLPVGMGTAYDVSGNPRLWDLRSAYAGAADPTTGSLVGKIDPDLHLRVELREEDSMTMLPAATSGLRPALSQLAGLDPLLVPDVPEVVSIPTDGSGMLTAPGFDLTFRDEIDDSTGLSLDGHGLYRVVLTEDLSGLPGRRWVLVALDSAMATTQTVHFPDLSPDPVPLQTGGAATTVRVSSYAYEAFPIFDPMDAEPDVFLWSDVAREVEAYAHTADVPFTLQ